MFSATIETATFKRFITTVSKAAGRYSNNSSVEFAQNSRGNMITDVIIRHPDGDRFITAEFDNSIIGDANLNLKDLAERVTGIRENHFNIFSDDYNFELTTVNVKTHVETGRERGKATPENWRRDTETETKPFITMLRRLAKNAADDRISHLDVIHIEPLIGSPGQELEKVFFIASNGFTLIKKEYSINIRKTFNLSRYDAETIVKLEKLFGDWLSISAYVDNETDPGYMAFTGDGFTYICPNRTDQYPDWQRVMPKNSSAWITFYQPKEFAEMLESAKRFSSNDTATITVNGSVELIAGPKENPDYQVEIIDVDYTGAAEFKFQPQLLINMIDKKARKLEILFSNSSDVLPGITPAKIINAELKETNIVMPVR
ncbi:MAG: hypothetical protein WCR87_08440 [Saccharofermentanales bacterium]